VRIEWVYREIVWEWWCGVWRLGGGGGSISLYSIYLVVGERVKMGKDRWGSEMYKVLRERMVE
jgi:hypothetical protein